MRGAALRTARFIPTRVAAGTAGPGANGWLVNVGRALRRLEPAYGPPPQPDPADHQASSGLRLLVAATAVGISYLDPLGADDWNDAAYPLLLAYLAYSAIGHALARWRVVLQAGVLYAAHWADVAVVALLVVFTGGPHSAYFAMFLFPILIASLRWGFREGLRVTVVCATIGLVVGFWPGAGHEGAEARRFLLRWSFLPLVGYLVAYRGGYELELRRRLDLLKDIATLSNPRFGPHRMMGRWLESVRRFYDARLCLVVLAGRENSPPELRRATRDHPDETHEPEPVAPELLTRLLSGGEDVACFNARARRPLVLVGEDGETRSALDSLPWRGLAEALGAEDFVTVPLRAAGKLVGRLYVAGIGLPLDPRDATFLLQAADQVVPVLAHMALVERMATRAAADERQRIALDIHDRLVQPYIGLQLGIRAAQQLIDGHYEPAMATVRERIEALARLTGLGIADLRGYIGELRGLSGASSGLGESLRRFAARYEELTGLEVALDLDETPALDGRLAGEVFSMVCEAISNVRRHTTARSARVSVRSQGPSLLVQVSYPSERASGAEDYVPRSIAARADAVNGTVRVNGGSPGTAAVVVEIPL